jgi:hypothetical protein
VLDDAHSQTLVDGRPMQLFGIEYVHVFSPSNSLADRSIQGIVARRLIPTGSVEPTHFPTSLQAQWIRPATARQRGGPNNY